MPSGQARRWRCPPDLPQGLLKKIELDLLLADLALQRRNSTLRPRQLLQGGSTSLLGRLLRCDRSLFVGRALGFAHPSAAAQRLAAGQTIAVTPFVDALA